MLYPLVVRMRSLLGKQMSLPDFVIAGAQKCGTTSLINYLARHPNIVPPVFKGVTGVKYFNRHFDKGPDWYRAHFPCAFYKAYREKVTKAPLLSGEQSPDYLADPHAPKRAFDLMPHVKLIMLFRNPVDRAYSHYHYRKKQGREHSSFEEAIHANKQALLQAGPDRVKYEQPLYTSYLARGIYVEQLKDWMNFFPREQFIFLSSEEFNAHPQKVVNVVHRFIGVEETEIPTKKRYNVGNYKAMPQALREELIDFFKPHNQRLSELLGIRFDWDK